LDQSENIFEKVIPAIRAAGVGVLTLSPVANAEEGGTGHYDEELNPTHSTT
jgi:hypothetical protein